MATARHPRHRPTTAGRLLLPRRRPQTGEAVPPSRADSEAADGGWNREDGVRQRARTRESSAKSDFRIRSTTRSTSGCRVAAGSRRRGSCWTADGQNRAAAAMAGSSARAPRPSATFDGRVLARPLARDQSPTARARGARFVSARSGKRAAGGGLGGWCSGGGWWMASRKARRLVLGGEAQLLESRPSVPRARSTTNDGRCQ